MSMVNLKLVNFMVNENLLKEFDYCVSQLRLTRTELLVALMEFTVKCSKEGQSFLKEYLETLKNYPRKTVEDARILASFYKEAFEHGKR
jgi:hypothetical protein